MPVYLAQQLTAEKLINQKGQAVTWNSIVNGAPTDADKPWNVGNSVSTPHSVAIVFMPFKLLSRKALYRMQGTEVAKGELYGLMKGNVDFTPKIKDTVTRGSETLTVRNLDVLSPNGEIILYTLEFER